MVESFGAGDGILTATLDPDGQLSLLGGRSCGWGHGSHPHEVPGSRDVATVEEERGRVGEGSEAVL